MLEDITDMLLRQTRNIAGRNGDFNCNSEKWNDKQKYIHK